MEGLNKLCLSIYLRPWISKHAWANSIAASRSRSKLKTQNPKPKGDHSHINNGTHWLSHFFYFHPLHQPKNPVFTKDCLPKSSIFSTLSKILEIFHSKTPNRLEFEKKVPKCPLFLGICHCKTPYFLPCMRMFERNVAPSNTVCRSWKILYSWNRIVQFGEYFLVQT